MSTTAQRLAEYEEALRRSQGYDPNKFQNEFEKAYGEATNYNKDLIEQQSKAMGEVQAVAPTLRERYMNTLITDPTAQMALIAQARQAPIQSYGTAANLLTARGQRYQDILGKALGGYQTAAQQAQMDAENRWRLYQDAVQQDQFNAQLRRTGGGGDGGITINWPGGETQTGGGNIIEVSDSERTPAQVRMDNKIAAANALTNQNSTFLQKLGNYYKTATNKDQGGSWLNLLNPIYGIATGTVALNNIINKWK